MDSNTYDELPYDCTAAYPYSQPNRLATIATLFGMTPPPVQNSRILELGCANGTNILAMGYALPQAQCLGIDSSSKQIEQGQALLSQLNLPNVTLQHKDILTIDADWGQFDYIIAHGIFSWVSDTIQAKMLEICQQNLSPNGVAYISFNTRPGWNMRSTIRDMMLYHVQQFDDIPTQVEQIQALVHFLGEATKEKKDLYSVFVQKEFKILQQQPESYLYHDFLEKYNKPIYFHEFVSSIKQHALQYLGDAHIQTMFSDDLTSEITAKLQNLTVVHREQYNDFLTNRSFRHSLICHQNLQLQRKIYPAAMKQFYLASQLKPVDKVVNIVSNQAFKFEQAGVGGVDESTPIVKSALVYLYQQWPQAIEFKELVIQATLQLSTASQGTYKIPENPTILEDTLAEVLLKCYLGGVIEATIYPPQCVTAISETPKVSDLALAQIEQGNDTVSNLRGEQLRYPPLFKDIIPALDGQHDEAALLEVLGDLTTRGIVVANKDGQPVGPEAVTPDMLQEFLQEILTHLANKALLVE